MNYVKISSVSEHLGMKFIVISVTRKVYKYLTTYNLTKEKMMPCISLASPTYYNKAKHESFLNVRYRRNFPSTFQSAVKNGREFL